MAHNTFSTIRLAGWSEKPHKKEVGMDSQKRRFMCNLKRTACVGGRPLYNEYEYLKKWKKMQNPRTFYCKFSYRQCWSAVHGKTAQRDEYPPFFWQAVFLG